MTITSFTDFERMKLSFFHAYKDYDVYNNQKRQKIHYQKCKTLDYFIPQIKIMTKVQKYFRFRSSPNKPMTKD